MMKIIVSGFLLLFCWMLPLGAFAQDFAPGMAPDNLSYPAYYRVVGVAADDALNMRSEGSAGAPVVGSLAYNAAPVEVIFTSGNWAYVSQGEASGFVSLSFLEPMQLDLISNTDLPQGLVCSGTEPFWGLRINAREMIFENMDAPATTVPITEAGPFHNLGGSTHFVLADQLKNTQNQRGLTAIITNRICSDGMSDLVYPREIYLLLPGPQGSTGLAGCCRLLSN